MSDVQDMEEYDNPLTTAFGRPPGPAPGWGRPPTGVWPPCPPRPGPWPGGLFRLAQCWDDVKATKAILRKMIADIIAEDPSLIGLAQPIIGVTDGSDAQPGQVGEFVQFSTMRDYAANTGYVASAQNLSVGVLQPGDWDVWLYAESNTVPASMTFRGNPPPVGFNDNLLASITNENWILSQQVRALLSVPTLIAGVLYVDTTGGPAGAVQIRVSARRRR